MNFTELFAKLPTSTLQDWEAAARKQLKGKPLASIDVSMGSGTVLSPYAAGTATSMRGGASQGWVQFSSFHHNTDTSGAELLEALNGGSQGLEIAFEDVHRISKELTEVRFDFISLKVNEMRPSNQAALLELIPSQQQPDAKLVISLDSSAEIADFEHLVSEVGSVTFMLSHTLRVDDPSSLSLVYNAMNKVLEPYTDVAEVTAVLHRLGLEINLSANYLANIVFIRAVRLLLANIYHAYGVGEPLPRPYLFGRIRPNIDEAGHETYLIDATARAVAGISGGIDALSIAPYPASDQALAARRARNIQNVLAIEGLLGLPVNAVEGAAFFETAAKDLVSSVWPHS